MAGASIVVDFDPVYNAYIQNVHACGPDCDANGKDDLAELNCFETTLASGSFPAIEAAYSANVAQANTDIGPDMLAIVASLDTLFGAWITLAKESLFTVEIGSSGCVNCNHTPNIALYDQTQADAANAQIAACLPSGGEGEGEGEGSAGGEGEGEGEGGTEGEGEGGGPTGPANDSCQSPELIAEDTPTPGTTVDATLDGGATCGGNADVWYEYIAPAAGIVTADTCGSALATVLSVYQFDCFGGEVACNTGACGAGNSRVIFRANSDALTTACSTPSFHDVWFQYTPPAGGTATVSLCGSETRSIITAYLSCNGVEFACSATGQCAPQPEMEMTVASGLTYFIRIGTDGSVNALPGKYAVRITRTPLTGGEGEGEGEGAAGGEGEGEGAAGGEGEGEGGGEGEGEGQNPEFYGTVDANHDNVISLSELLRVIQFYNSGGIHCAQPPSSTEDGYAPGPGADHTCTPYVDDYNPQDWVISLSELLRVIQFYNAGGYHYCPGQATEDGFCPGI